MMSGLQRAQREVSAMSYEQQQILPLLVQSFHDPSFFVDVAS